MKRVLKWALLLNKRLYKKPSFWILLILIPVLVLGYGAFAREDSGMLTVALALEDPKDPAANDFVQSLRKSSELILFTTYTEPEDATESVRYGKSDAAWILPGEFAEHIKAFVENRFQNGGFIRVVIRQKDLTTMLSLEKLGSLVFNRTARELFADYIQTNISGPDGIPEASIYSHYDAVVQGGDMFEYAYPFDVAMPENARNYLLSPLRGLFGILILVSGLITAMYYMEDRNRGLFSWIPFRYHSAVELGYQAVSVGNVALFSWIALTAVGLTTGFFTELIITFLYILCCASFCRMLRVWCGNVAVMGALLPICVVCMLLLCPVFLDFGALCDLSYLFPPTYYINCAFRTPDIWNMLIYTLGCTGLYYLGKRIR